MILFTDSWLCAIEVYLVNNEEAAWRRRGVSVKQYIMEEFL